MWSLSVCHSHEQVLLQSSKSRPFLGKLLIASAHRFSLIQLIDPTGSKQDFDSIGHFVLERYSNFHQVTRKEFELLWRFVE